MIDYFTPPRRRLRRWAPKTRSGCSACRKRRVKCDETRPVCYACIRLGQTCVYRVTASGQYDRGVDMFSSYLSYIGSIGNISSNTPEEALHLNVYSEAIAPWLSTYSQTAFFEQVLPHWSYHHQAIKHALVAVAMAGEKHYLGKRVSEHRRIWHYDQALKHMYARKASTDVVMLACVVLWLHDNIIEDTRPAVIHVKGFVNMLLAYEKHRTPAGVGKNLDCTIWRGLSHWGQRTQPCIDTRLGLEAVATVRQKLKDPRLGLLSQETTSCTADALLFVTSVVYACDEYSADDTRSSTITFQELRSFLDCWYAAALVNVELVSDDHIILKCHYTVMSLIIRGQERLSVGQSPDLIDDVEALVVFDNMLTSLESLRADSLVQLPGKRDLFLPIIPLALEAERIAPTMLHKLRIETILRSIKRVESFWSTSVVAGVINASLAKHAV